ncbi:MAG: HpyAIV family type II restriction enzyme [Candidatus Nanoarchaeia archaeon]
MKFEEFKGILNKQIFEESKAVLIRKISKYPGRYIGLFRPTKPKAKILQNLLQSHEIRFGDAFEILIEAYLKKLGYEILDKNFSTENNDRLDVDQCFRKNGKVYFVEQKVRDDHDSSKKRGQIQNFENKLGEIINKYGEKNLVGVFYFIDPELKKNKNYYTAELERMSKDYGVTLSLDYGEELFEFLGHSEIWEEILKYLKEWKKEIPELPETNFDLDAESSFEEIKDLNPSLFRTIFDNEEIFNEIVLTIFPEKKTLKLLLDYFESKSEEKTIYKTLSELLKKRL